jgi:hypothetical protein
MIKVSFQTDKNRFTIPLPFFVLRITGTIICSKWFWKQINKRVDNNTFPIPLLDKQILQSILLTLQEHKGKTIVDLQGKDGKKMNIQL